MTRNEKINAFQILNAQFRNNIPIHIEQDCVSASFRGTRITLQKSYETEECIIYGYKVQLPIKPVYTLSANIEIPDFVETRLKSWWSTLI